jgi:hypothetical protein
MSAADEETKSYTIPGPTTGQSPQQVAARSRFMVALVMLRKAYPDTWVEIVTEFVNFYEGVR